VQLTKHHGLGNDFLIVLDEANGSPPAPTAALARSLCDRHTGLGADGLVWGRRPETGDDGADVVFQLWNADGSEAEVSGNGLRCLAQALARARGLRDGVLHLRTQGGLRRASVRGTEDPRVLDIEVEMGPVTEGPPLVVGTTTVAEASPGTRPVWGPDAQLQTVSVGNPHVVVLVDDPAEIDLAGVGAAYEQAVEGGINAEFIAVVAPDTLELTVWERGAGITQACGSGATAAAHVAHGWGLVGERVDVRMPGGTATVTLAPEGARLAGPSTFVAAIEVPDA
jgi:diaminopimelate epimerase